MSILTDMSSAQATALWSGLLILLMVILGVGVAVARRGEKVVLGDGGNARVLLASRVFGNAAEYAPVSIAALVVLTNLGMPAYVIHVLGGVLFLGRLIHAGGLSTEKATAGRVLGMSLTWLPLFLAGLMMLVHAFIGIPHF